MVREDLVFQIVREGELLPLWIDEISNLPVSIRPLYQCKYGCSEYGRYPSCPPHTGTFDEITRFIKSYKWFILVTTENTFLYETDITISAFDEYKRVFQEKLINIQKALYGVNLFHAFPLFPGSCSLCPVCGMPERCFRPQDVRPAVSAMGIELIDYLQEREHKLGKLNIPLHTDRLFSIILLE